MERQSLNTKLMLPVIISVIIVGLLLVWLIPAKQAEQRLHNIQHQLDSLAEHLSQDLIIHQHLSVAELADDLNQLIAATDYLQHAGIYMVDKQSGHQTLLAEATDYPGIETFLTKKNANLLLTASAPINTPDFNGVVVVSHDDNLMRNELHNLRLPLYAAFTVITLLLGLIYWLISKDILMPIAHAARIARRLSEGDVDSDLPTQHPVHEITTLYKALLTLQNNLAQEKQRNSELLNHAESEVEKRTQELRSTLTQLRSNLYRLHIVIRAANAAVWVWNMENNHIELTGDIVAILQLEEHSGGALTIDNLFELIHPEDRQRFRNLLRERQDGDSVEINVRLALRESGYRWFLINGEHIQDSDKGSIIGSLIDMHERIEQEQKIWRMAHLDDLTDIPNRSLFNKRFEEIIDSNNTLTAIITDINDFKVINDTLGHLAGDCALREYARNLQATLHGNSIIARLGGDEFGVLITPALTEKELENFFESVKLRASKIDYGNEDGQGIRFSMGVANYPEHGDSREAIMRAADTAMYAAKRHKLAGSAIALFHDAMYEERVRYVAIRDKIEIALTKSQFEAWYQPIWDTQTGKIASAELLLRWPGSDVNIEELIRVAESSSLILQLGEWTLQEACGTIGDLEQLVPSVTVAVNFSPIQFRHQNIPELIERLTTNKRAPARRLVVEITEGTFLDNIDHTQQVIERLADMGVSIAIDDFGTGYSSLRYLQLLTVDWIKIDRSFVTDIHERIATYQIVNAIIQMGHAMSIGLVAEGVEKEEEYEILQRLGCQRIQGYLKSKPLCKDDFLKLVAKTNL